MAAWRDEGEREREGELKGGNIKVKDGGEVERGRRSD